MQKQEYEPSIKQKKGVDVLKSDLFDSSGDWNPKGGELYFHSHFAEHPAVTESFSAPIDYEVLDIMERTIGGAAVGHCLDDSTDSLLDLGEQMMALRARDKSSGSANAHGEA